MRQLTITQSITNRDTPSLEKYLLEIGKLDMVTAEEEVQLAQRIKAGDQIALDKLTKANLRFVVSVAKQYQFQGLALVDLINEGNIGLIKAAQRFDETRGFKFISYAVWWIRQSIIQAILEKGRMVHLPINKSTLSLKIQKAYSILEQDLERAPSVDEVAALLDVNVTEVKITSELGLYHASLDAPLAQGEDGTLMDTIQNTAPSTDVMLVHHASLHIEVERSLKTLSKIEKEVICFFFGIGMPHPCSLNEISDKYNLTKERIRQIKDVALLKLRSTKKAQSLRTFLGN
ncbi:MAG TPA: RNA polymerase sigma factor RpoD/SigA [Flavisolibacter sp.]|nr:RNA polymerase sigma factor RpoD/SigA [Flavisolibacter sp.]